MGSSGINRVHGGRQTAMSTNDPQPTASGSAAPPEMGQQATGAEDIVNKNDEVHADEHVDEDDHDAPKFTAIFWVLVMIAAFVLLVIYAVVKVDKSDCDHGTALPYVIGQVVCVLVFYRKTMWPVLILLL